MSSPQSPGLQKQLDAVINVAEKSRSSSPATAAPGSKPNLVFSDMNLGTSRTGAGGTNGEWTKKNCTEPYYPCLSVNFF